MAKTLTTQLLITSSDLFDGNAFKIVQTDELTIEGDVINGSQILTTASVQLWDSGDAKAYVYLKNSSTADDEDDLVDVSIEVGGVWSLVLKPGEWSWVRYDAAVGGDLAAKSSANTGNPLIDYLICVDTD
tara:strand:- start:350 stop:739 length:390 start_codon:yes stop_codon:yes gene_type:complete